MFPCPDTELLRELLDETLSDTVRASIETHIETCFDCERVLGELTMEERATFQEHIHSFASDFVGQRIGRFQIIRRFDGGGQGDLFIARDQELEREVAVKRIKESHADDWWHRGALIREALITGGLEHPGIVPVYGLGYDQDGQSYYAMRLIRSLIKSDDRGHTLQDAIASFHNGQTTWTLHSLLERFVAICNTVHYAHDQGLIHCDLKPQNVALGPYGETLVLDWGAARPLVSESVFIPESDEERNGHAAERHELLIKPVQFQFTPAYASPELIAGRLDELGRTSDVYSLGAILHCLLNGQPPRRPSSRPDQENDPTITSDPSEQRRLRWTVPRPLKKICSKALAHDAKDRYATAGMLAEDISRWMADEPVSAFREGKIDRLFRLARRHRAWALAGAVALLLITGVAVSAALLVNRARGAAVSLSAELADERGDALCDQGDPQQGILWLARALEIKPGDGRDLRRLNLEAWTNRLCRLADYRSLPLVAERFESDPSGRYLVLASFRNEATLCDATTGNPIGNTPLVQNLGLCVFSQDGSRLLTRNGSDGADIWETATGKLLCRLPTEAGNILSATFSADCKAVLTGNDQGIAQLWSAVDGRTLGSQIRHRQQIRSVALSSDGKTALTGSNEGTARLWDLTSGKQLAATMDHGAKSIVLAAALSPDGRTALTGTSDGTARFWDTATATLRGQPLHHPASVERISFSSDSKRALTGGMTDSVWLWDTETVRPVGKPIYHNMFICSAAFSPDGQFVVTGGEDGTARVWNAVNGDPKYWPLTHGGSVKVARFDAKGKCLRTVSTDGTVRRWEFYQGENSGALVPRQVEFDLSETGQPEEVADVANFVSTLGFGFLDQRVLFGTFTKVEVRDMRSGASVGPPIRHGQWMNSAKLSPDGRTILTISQDSQARLWDVSEGVCLHKFLHDAQVVCCDFHPNPKVALAVTGSEDGIVRVWNVVTGHQVGQDMRHGDRVQAVAFSPGDNSLLTACLDGTVSRWDPMTGVHIDTPLRLNPIGKKMLFSPDRKSILALLDRETVRLWSLGTDKFVSKPLKHGGHLWVAAFSPDGTLLLTACSDDCLRLWDVSTGRLIGPPILLRDEIRAVAFGIDGRTIMTGDSHGKVRLWTVAPPPSQAIERLACWSQVLTGMEIDSTGATNILSVERWNQLRRRLDGLGGPPPL